MLPAALAHFGLARAAAQPLGDGFSDAPVWHVIDGERQFALKSHPLPADRLPTVHAWMRHARDRGCPFVPAPRGLTVAGGRCWELLDWIAGEPTLVTPAGLVRSPLPPALRGERVRVRGVEPDGRTTVSPTPDESPLTLALSPRRAGGRGDRADKNLDRALDALAQLHVAWQPLPVAPGPCPGIRRRLEAHAAYAADLPPWLRPHWPAIPATLAPFASRPVPIQPCLCDCHPAHFLFDSDHLAGVIDFAAAKLDHPAVDLARLLGELLADGDPRWAAALARYSAARHRLGSPIPDDELALVPPLATTGRLVALAVSHRRGHAARVARLAAVAGILLAAPFAESP